MKVEEAACPGCEGERTEVFLVDGMCCASEATLVEQQLRALPGVCSVHASAVTGKATVVHTIETPAIARVLATAGFKARAADQAPRRPVAWWPTLAALALTAAGVGAGFFSRGAAIAFYLPAIFVGGAPVAGKGLRRLRHGVLDMNALMTVAVLGAMAIGEWGEGASTVVLFSLAQLLEARSLERARQALTGLLNLAPETARVRREDVETRVAVEAVGRGDELVVGPGERVPLDGVVTRGTSEVDQSPLTGESRPVAKEKGDGVFAGSINGSGVLVVRVTRRSSETTLARLLRRVEEAQSSRAPSQGFVDAFARVYTPAVVAFAVLVAAVPPLFGHGALFDWTYRALVLLVIACPCALVISTPVSIVSALTAASRRGVLVKGGAHLEQMGALRGIVFDKTGTLTLGEPTVVEVRPASGRTRAEALGLAAAVEAHASHPIAEAIVARARAEGVAHEAAEGVTVLPGRGARGLVGGQAVLVGSHRLFDESGLCDHRLDGELARLESEGKTAVLVGLESTGGVVGVLGIGDAVRPEAAAAVAELREEGLRVAMLTGDNARTAEAIAAPLGIEERWADLLPEDKVARVRELTERWGDTAMVGDGVNDAPALATAQVGIAMGRRGTDVALETADVVLMREDLRRLPETIRLGRRARDTIRQNIALSLAVKAAVLGLALAGYGSLWAAVAADMGASLLVIGNGLRLLKGGGAEDERVSSVPQPARS